MEIMNKGETRQHIVITVMMTVILGQFYFNPFGTEFRITLAVIAHTFLLIYFDDTPIIKTCIITGFFVFLFRSLLLVGTNGTLSGVIAKYLPSMIYYITFGLVLYIADIRNRMRRPFLVFFILSFSDILSNIVELSIRGGIASELLPKLTTNIFITGFARGFISLVLYWTFQSMKELALREEKRKEKENLFVLSSKIIGERYYLNKSMEDIENLMEASHNIYLEIRRSDFGRKNPEVSKRLIGLSNSIHEIKKDYRRIVAGLEGIVPDLKTQEVMKVSDVYNIIFDTNKRYERLTEKNILLRGICSTSLETRYYLSLTSIINNLINNAIDASYMNSRIDFNIVEISDNLVITVKDEGCGIDKKDMKLIFNSGFSTKYDKKTGKMSTGVGLTHVKTLVEELFQGKIEVESGIGKGTVFTITLPFTKFIKTYNDSTNEKEVFK